MRFFATAANTAFRHTLSIFFDLKTVCMILKLAMNSYSCLAVILTRCMGTSPIYMVYGEKKAKILVRFEFDRKSQSTIRTVNGVNDLAVRGSGPTLLHLCVVQLKQVVQPCQ